MGMIQWLGILLRDLNRYGRAQILTPFRQVHTVIIHRKAILTAKGSMQFFSGYHSYWAPI